MRVGMKNGISFSTWVNYNAHPKGLKVSDCVKRAICTAEERDYREVSIELNRFKKISGASQFNDDKNWKKYLETKGYIKLSFQPVKGEPRVTLNDFCLTHTKGNYIISVAKHLTSVKDGKFYDTWDCGQKCVYNAWKVK